MIRMLCIFFFISIVGCASNIANSPQELGEKIWQTLEDKNDEKFMSYAVEKEDLRWILLEYSPGKFSEKDLDKEIPKWDKKKKKLRKSFWEIARDAKIDWKQAKYVKTEHKLAKKSERIATLAIVFSQKKAKEDAILIEVCAKTSQGWKIVSPMISPEKLKMMGFMLENIFRNFEKSFK